MEEDIEDSCYHTGNCETETGSEKDLDMCKHCGALMYYIDGFWYHHSLVKIE